MFTRLAWPLRKDDRGTRGKKKRVPPKRGIARGVLGSVSKKQKTQIGQGSASLGSDLDDMWCNVHLFFAPDLI